ncbi:hypothetical protein HanIR_Chr09g0394031 [Helianthus annuus]|nr:hypothetical protein HanIR_Chr09g0394031 [Helianthus annuus]
MENTYFKWGINTNKKKREEKERDQRSLLFGTLEEGKQGKEANFTTEVTKLEVIRS